MKKEIYAKKILKYYASNYLKISKYVVLSYNNEGFMSRQDIETTMTKYGHYEMFSQEHQRFRADKEENRNHLANKTIEYLHVLEKA